MSALALIMVSTALTATIPTDVSGGFTAPERIRHTYEITCGGRVGRFNAEEHFVRSVPASTVWITGYTPLGATKPEPVSIDVARAATRMARIDRVTWLCDQRRATLFVRYLDRATYDRAVKEDLPPPDDQARARQLVFVLDNDSLRLDAADSPTAGGVDLPDSAQPGTILADIHMSEWTSPKRLSLDVRFGAYSIWATSDGGTQFTGDLIPRQGLLPAISLKKVQVAYADVQSQGIGKAGCQRDTSPLADIVVGTAGTPKMSVGSDRGQLVASEALGCWTPVATTLHRLLEDTFAPIINDGKKTLSGVTTGRF